MQSPAPAIGERQFWDESRYRPEIGRAKAPRCDVPTHQKIREQGMHIRKSSRPCAFSATSLVQRESNGAATIRRGRKEEVESERPFPPSTRANRSPDG